ncbi:MAG: hypothetical protein J6U13_01005 [Salinivirgaceae bacterium]|nr:hypothetical protein [Salinivirgaceae bacterium]
MNHAKHNIKSSWLIIVALFVCMLSVSCSHSNRGTRTKEGSIKFRITYLKSEKEYPIIGLLPSTLQMRFKDGKVILDLEGWLGIFKSSFIKDEKQNVFTLLKILNKRYLYVSNAGESYYGISINPDIDIAFDDQTKDILGFDCQHALVTLPDSTNFDIYYTSDIKVGNPTVNTPLDKIPGMLLEFNLEMNGIPMRLEAIEFHNEKIPDSAFEIPEGFEKVDRAQMDDIFFGINK